MLGQRPDKAVRALLLQERECKGDEECKAEQEQEQEPEERAKSIFPAARPETDEETAHWARGSDDDDIDIGIDGALGAWQR